MATSSSGSKISLGLDRIQRLLQHISYTRPTIHVAGTNGKGSVSTLIESVLTSSDLKVGKFTSPHLVSVEDCISLSGYPIPASEYSRISLQVQEISEKNQITATSFELLTVVALCAFEEAAVDVVILEVGMGGRLDATNAIHDDRVLVCAVASVDFDHQAFLGSTIRAIAGEKCAIVRQNGVLVLGDQGTEYTADVEAAAEEAVSKAGAEMVQCRDTDLILDEDEGAAHYQQNILFKSLSAGPTKANFASVKAKLSLLGSHQLSNARLALTVLRVLKERRPHGVDLFERLTDEHVRLGFERARWKGRLSWHLLPLSSLSEDSEDQRLSQKSGSIRVLVDGAHNAGSARTLGAYLDSLPSSSVLSATPTSRPSLTFIIALSYSAEKPPLTILSPFLRKGDRVALVPFTEPVEGMPWVRNVRPDEPTSTIPGETFMDVVEKLTGEGEVKMLDESGVSNPPSARLRDALRWALDSQRGGENNGSPVVIAGSLYLVGDFYRFFGGKLSSVF